MPSGVKPVAGSWPPCATLSMIDWRGIASDIAQHVNAVNFVRVVSETAAAVLVTLVWATVFGAQWW